MDQYDGLDRHYRRVSREIGRAWPGLPRVGLGLGLGLSLVGGIDVVLVVRG